MFEKVKLKGKYQIESGTKILFVWGLIPYELTDPRWIGLGISLEHTSKKATVKSCYWIHKSKTCAKCLVDYIPESNVGISPIPSSVYLNKITLEKEVKHAAKHISTSNRLATENIVVIYIEDQKYKFPWEGSPSPQNLREWLYDNYPRATQAMITNKNKIVAAWHPILKLR